MDEQSICLRDESVFLDSDILSTHKSMINRICVIILFLNYYYNEL